MHLGGTALYDGASWCLGVGEHQLFAWWDRWESMYQYRNGVESRLSAIGPHFQADLASQFPLLPQVCIYSSRAIRFVASPLALSSISIASSIHLLVIIINSLDFRRTTRILSLVSHRHLSTHSHSLTHRIKSIPQPLTHQSLRQLQPDHSLSQTQHLRIITQHRPLDTKTIMRGHRPDPRDFVRTDRHP